MRTRLSYRRQEEGRTADEIRTFLEKSPIKSKFTPGQIATLYLSIRERLGISFPRGVRRRYLILACAFKDILSDTGKIRVICDAYGFVPIGVLGVSSMC